MNPHIVIRKFKVSLVLILFIIGLGFLFFKCEKPEHVLIVETLSISDTTFNSIIATGIILDKGKTPISQYGFCWSRIGQPNLQDSVMYIQGELNNGMFTGTVTNLQPDSKYYLSAFAENTEEVVLGNDLTFKTRKINSIYSPDLSTFHPIEVTESSIIIEGKINDPGNCEISHYGHCWGTSPQPDIELTTKTDKGTCTDTTTFKSNIQGLKNNTTYYIRSYAVNESDTSYGNEVEITTYKNTRGEFTDPRDGQTYYTVQIGSQWWMAENLNYYTDSASWYYENDSITYSYTHGRLYTWPTAKNVCPEGWHLPSDEEWKQLEISLGMTQDEADSAGYRGTNEGSLIKKGNTTGFDALFSGYRSQFGDFYSMEVFGYFWTSSEQTGENAVNRFIHKDEARINRNYLDKLNAFSVRCVKD